jgi:hypothetical protein
MASGALNVSVLGAAKETYTDQLKIHLVPLIHEGFISLYEDAKMKEESEGGHSIIKQFQVYLKDIPNWNQSILEEETRRILNKVDFLMELVTAVFVSHVKILASVKLSGNNRNIRIKIPTSDILIHTIYTNAAEMFYYDPIIFVKHLSRENYERIRTLIRTSIDDTINSMIPIESILKEYLSKVFSGHITEPKQEPPKPEPPIDRLLTSDDMNLSTDSDPFSTPGGMLDTPDNDHFGTGGGDPFSNPFDDKEIFEKSKEEDAGSIGSDPFKSDPFSSLDGMIPKKTDLFGTSDPFGDSNSFGTSNSFGGNDIFGSKNISLEKPKELLFKDDDTVPDDPFATKDDPFATKDDPFATKDDPFSTPKDDPFSTPKDDPFSGSDDLFSTPKDDPFADSSPDPFSGSDDLFGNTSPPELSKDDDVFSEKESIKFFENDDIGLI